MINASVNMLSQSVLLQVGGNGLFQQWTHSNPFSSLVDLAQEHPYITAGGIFAAATAGTIAAVRLWQRRQESLPPAGMTDIPPRRMEEFFARRANDPEAVAHMMLGFRTNEPAKTSKENLAGTRRLIAEEISDLNEILKAMEGSPNAKKRALVAEAINAYKDLEAFCALRSGEKVRAREDILNKPDEVFVSIAKRLNDLLLYRAILTVQYIRKAYAEGAGALPGEKPNAEIAAAYKGMGEEASRAEARRAIRVWQKLTSAERNVFRPTANDQRDPMLGSSFLFVYLRLRNSPEVPNDAAAQEGKILELVRAEIKRIEATRALPAHIKDMEQAMVVLRTEILRRGGLHAGPSALLMTPVKVVTGDGPAQVELQVGERPHRVDPAEILIVRDDTYRAGDTSWMHPDVVAAHANAPDQEKPRLVLDLSILPAPSLGEGHKVVVDMEDRRMKEYLESLRPYRERLEKGESSAVIAGEIWKNFRSGTEKPDKERLIQAAGRGNVHSLFDLIENTALIERSILVQIAFQYVGIRSSLEKNQLSVTSVKDKREIELGQQLWIRLWLSGQSLPDSYILHCLLPKFLKASDQNFDRFVDQPSHAGAAPSSGRSSDSASGPKPVTTRSRLARDERSDVTPLPAPVPPPEDDDDNRPTLIPPASGSAATVLAPIPQPTAIRPPPPPVRTTTPDVSSVGRDEPTMQIHISELKGMAVRAELIVALRERFRNLNNDDPETTNFTANIAKTIFEAWDQAGRPAAEFDERGFPKSIPEDFVHEGMEKWLQDKEKSPFPKDRADAAALRAADQGGPGQREFGAGRKTPSQPPSISRVGPPPLPPTAEEIKADIRNMAFRRYPSLREEVASRLVGAFVNEIYEKAGDNAEKQMEILVAGVRNALKHIHARPTFRDVAVGILAADGIWDELRERRRAFRETTWSAALQDALQVIYEAWKKGDRAIETSPSKTPLIAEEIFEAGYKEFFALLQRRYPNVPEEVLKQTFMDSDEGPRSVRWAPAEEVGEDELIVEAPPPSAQKTSEVSNVRVRPASSAPADATARLLDRYPFLLSHIPVARALSESIAKAVEGGMDIGQALDIEIGNLFLHLANTPRLNPKQEAILKGLAEADLVRALKDNYTFFRDPKRPRAAQVQAAEIYRIWNANNRTFDGREKTRPLRIPERFLEQWMDVLIGHLHKSDRAMADAIAGSRVDRNLKRHDSSRPPAAPTIPISEETILLELVDRVPEFASNKAQRANILFLAQTIYKTWLKTDPARNLERSGSGLHGLVPEAILEDKLKRFLAYLQTTKVAFTDRGNREARGTGVLEREIQKRNAAA